MKKTFETTRSFDLQAALELSTKLKEIVDIDELVFDFRNTRFVEPFSLLLISSEISRFMYRNASTTVSCQNYKHMTYAGHMGFFRAFGLDFGKSPGEATGSHTYIPMTIFDCQVLVEKAMANGLEIGDVIETESGRMAQLLCGTDHGDVFDTLTYSVREIVRNVVEHSQADQFGICAQYWPTKNRVEVAVIDRGIGLRKSLIQNPHIDASDDKRAINYALMPAISGKAFKGARQKQKGHWANSGFGLYMTSRICRNGGNFFVASGSGGMLITTKAQAKRYFECDFQGTAIRMVVKTDSLNSLNESLQRYREEGFEIQRRYKEIVSIDPSSASLMLSDDFDLTTWEKILTKLRLRSSRSPS